MAGAIQHQQVFDGLKCTISFVTERNDEEGFVLASHCTNEDEDIGGHDNATIHQPNNPFFGSNVIGEERIDPSLRDIDDDLCLYNHVCRYSDAAYAELDEDLNLGGIAGPDSRAGWLQLDQRGPRLQHSQHNQGGGVLRNRRRDRVHRQNLGLGEGGDHQHLHGDPGQEPVSGQSRKYDSLRREG